MEDGLQALPEGVRRAAAEFHGNIRDRLVQGEKMIGVWQRLLKRNVNVNAVNSLSDKDRCRDETGLDIKNVAAAALFYIAIQELTDITHYDSNQNERLVVSYKDVASICANMKNLRYLGGIHEYVGELHPYLNSEMHEALTKSSFFSIGSQKRWNDHTAERDEHRDDRRSRFKKTAPRSQGEETTGIPHPSSARGIRTRVSAFIEAADKLYDKPPLTKPLADIASAVVAEPIEKKLIENCRRSLITHRGPQSTRQS